MANNDQTSLESVLSTIAARHAAETAQAVQSFLGRLIGTPGAAAAPLAEKRKPGRPPKVAVTSVVAAPAAAPNAKATPKAKPASPAKARKVKRRTAEQVAKDEAAILSYVHAHAGQGSIEIGKALGLRKEYITSGLERLKATGKVKMKGERSRATYSAA